MKEMISRIKAIEEYLKYYPNDNEAKKNLFACECANAIGMDLDTSRVSYYPIVRGGYFKINPQIKIGKRYRLTNSHTGYQQDGKETLVIWDEPCGRLAFVNEHYWEYVEGEWQEFMNALKSYEPLDYDCLNNAYVYDAEHGKKLIDDYDKIVEDFRDKIEEKINKVRRDEKRAQFELLKKELEEADNA